MNVPHLEMYLAVPYCICRPVRRVRPAVSPWLALSGKTVPIVEIAKKRSKPHLPTYLPSLPRPYMDTHSRPAHDFVLVVLPAHSI